MSEGTKISGANVMPGTIQAVSFDSRRLRLRTLIGLRWFAIVGQSVSVILVHYFLGYPLPLFLCMVAILSSVIVNIFLIIAYPLSELLDDREAAFYLGFDILQLTVLLYLTGGVQNPFALLYLAPVTISASWLKIKNTLLLGGLAFCCVTFLTFQYRPLPWADVAGLDLPLMYMVGLWIALLFGIGFTAIYASRLAMEANRMSDALTATQLVLAREQKLSAVGALAAAAAHELGTPLATIQVVSKELLHDVSEGDPLREDCELLYSQSKRCRDILAELAGRSGEEDEIYATLPVGSLVQDLLSHHHGFGVEISLKQLPSDQPEPKVWRRPEILHGLECFIENAVDFASSQVVAFCRWDEALIEIVICDDGPGFASDILPRLGEPYVTSRARKSGAAEISIDSETGIGGGLGLGFFIAKTLLERSGAWISFANRDQLPADSPAADLEFLRGAVVTVIWPRDAIEVKPRAG